MALFTTQELKDHEGISVATHDTFIGQLATRVSIMVARFLGLVDRTGGSMMEDSGTDSTEDYDGDGTPDLLLRRVPVISVTYVYSDQTRGFAGGTLIAAADYLVDKDHGRVRLLPQAVTAFATRGLFPKGIGNIRATYRGGYTAATIPADIKEAALLWAAAIFNRRRAAGVISESIGSYSVTYERQDRGGMPAQVRGLLFPHRRHFFSTFGRTA